MDFQIRITQAALADFQRVLDYSWEHFPATAESFGNAILNHIELLKGFPYIGSPVAENRHVRQLLHTPVEIYYRVHERPNFIEVLHFWYTSRRPPKS